MSDDLEDILYYNMNAVDLGYLTPGQGKFLEQSENHYLYNYHNDIGETANNVIRAYSDFRKNATPREKINYTERDLSNLGSFFGETSTYLKQRVIQSASNLSLGRKGTRRIHSYKFAKNVFKNDYYIRIEKNKISTCMQYVLEDIALPNAKQYFDSAKELREHAFSQAILSGQNRYLLDEELIEQRNIAKAKANDMLGAFYPEYSHSFFSKESIWVEGQEYMWEFTLNNADSYHCGLTVNLHNKQRDLLCRLCVYFEDTYSAEQLISFITYIRNGMEQAILDSGNILSPTDLGRTHFGLEDRAVNNITIDLLNAMREYKEVESYDDSILTGICDRVMKEYATELLKYSKCNELTQCFID